MGFYLTKPITEKETVTGECPKFNYVLSGMQGWRTEMEDAHLCHVDTEKQIYVFGVFDGHGGKEVAKFAAQHFFDVLKENASFKEKKYEQALMETFYEIDEMLLKPEHKKELKMYKADKKPGDKKETLSAKDNDEAFESNAGCTANVALMIGNDLYVANAGDSRCVIAEGGKCEELSIDHKPDNDGEKTRIIKAGGSVYNGRVNGNLSLSRALGDFDYKGQTKLPKDEQLITATPEIKHKVLSSASEFLILGCDGIWETLPTEKIVDFVRERLAEKKNLKDVVESLMDTLLAKDTTVIHGLDNMTCIIVEFKKN